MLCFLRFLLFNPFFFLAPEPALRWRVTGLADGQSKVTSP